MQYRYLLSYQMSEIYMCACVRACENDKCIAMNSLNTLTIVAGSVCIVAFVGDAVIAFMSL